jgi:hypothetical protein
MQMRVIGSADRDVGLYLYNVKSAYMLLTVADVVVCSFSVKF